MSDADLNRARRARDVFEAVVELQGTARSAVLCEACGDDLDLHHEVQALLDELPRAGTQELFPRLCSEMLRLFGAPPGDTAVDDRVLTEASAMADNGDAPDSRPLVAMEDVNDVSAAQRPRKRRRSAHQIGQYRVTGRIGRGGMGTVYAGEHVLLGRPAAIKVLLPELSRNQDMVMRFFNEARAATAIRHPGIVEIYDFGWNADGTAFLVMERLEGETLARRLARRRLGWKAALAIVRQIAGALSAAHDKGIVHRDLKPDNIFLVLDPEVPGGERIKLLDFGIAKLAGESAAGMHVTRTGAVMGTPTYMSPEQCRGVSADHRADLYALGCIAFELCGGQPPFIGTGRGDVLAAHIHVHPPTIAAVGSDVPPELERLVQQLLAKSPSERVQSAADLIRAVDTITTDADGAPPTAAAPSETPPALAGPSITTLCSAASAGTPRLTRTSAGRRSLAMRFAVAAVLGGTLVASVAIGMLGGGEQIAQPPAPRRPSIRATPPQPAPSSTPAAAPAPRTLEARGASAPDISPPSPPPVELAIDSIPTGAQIVLDGAVLGNTPYHGTISWPGADLTLVVRLAGYVNKRVVARTVRSIHKTLKLVRIAPVLEPIDRDESVNPF